MNDLTDRGPRSSRSDRLARALHALRMRSAFYCHAELSEPWALAMPTLPDTISFHVVTSGHCRLRVEAEGAGESERVVMTEDVIELRVGDLALVPHGRGHDLLSGEGAGTPQRVDSLPQRYSGENYSELSHGGGGRTSRLICGIVSFDDPIARELMRRLPAVVTVNGESASASSSIRDTLRLMHDELSHPQPGSETVATRLADILVVQALRNWLLNEADATAGWLQALRDEGIGRALEAMHARPGNDWSLERLARLASMSRTAFATRFASLVGESPIAYLTRWRMNLAHSQLREAEITVGRLSAELGYRSEAAFSRAFTRVIGHTPGSVRRERRSGASPFGAPPG